MTEITLVRHGQANAGAKTEEEYDRLSDLGRQQARWLGQYFSDTGYQFDHVIHGALFRQRDTAAAICDAIGVVPETDARLDELDYFGLAASLETAKAVPVPNGREEFLEHVPQVLTAWREKEIGSPKESYAEFEERVRLMLELAQNDGRRVMLVTSGGVISMMMRIVLGLNDAAHAGILLQTFNGSFHQFSIETGKVLLSCYNAVPHLEGPERVGAKSYI